MKPDLKHLFLKKMNTKGLVIILIIGVSLLVLPGLFSKPAQPEKTKTQQESSFNYSSYESELETRLAKILSTVKGISDVSVMITLEDSGENYYAQNEKTDQKSAGEGTIKETSQTLEDALALKNDAGGGQSPVLLKTGTPRISGVLVTAKGVTAPAIEAEIINAIRAVFNVSLHRVQVLEKA